MNPLLPPVFVTSTDGVDVALHDLGGEGPGLLLAHANGFNGHIWLPIVEQLRSQYHCWALDFRGHGFTRTPADLNYDWGGLGDDVVAAIERLLEDEALVAGEIHAAGWSMGGCALLMAEQRHPGLLGALWAYEPIVFPSHWREDAGLSDQPNPLVESARRRREVFDSRQAAFDNYGSKPPFAAADQRALRAYVDYGFENLEDGTVRLRCRGATEAALFEAPGNSVFESLGSVPTPTVVVGSGDGGPPSTIAAEVASGLARGSYESMPELTHFGPMEDPDRIATSLRKALAR